MGDTPLPSKRVAPLRAVNDAQLPGCDRSLRDVLELIRARPAMYLRTKSVTALSHFIHGYRMACWVHAIAENGETATHGLDSEFAEWLAREKALGEGAQDPLYQLVEELGDEAEAFDRFFELLDEHEAT